MTSLLSSQVDSRLAGTAAEIESQEIGLRVIAGQVFRLPLFGVHTNAIVQTARPLSILEEFVMRAAHDFVPPPQPDELAKLLGLDRLFIDGTLRDLERSRAATLDTAQAIVLTDLGRQHYAQGLVPQPPETKSLSLVYWGLLDRIEICEQPEQGGTEEPLLPGLSAEDCRLFSERALLAAADLGRVIEVTQHAGLTLHAPEDGRVITEVRASPTTTEGSALLGILVVQDTAVVSPDADNLLVRVVDLEQHARVPEIGAAIEACLAEGRITLADLLPTGEPPGTTILPMDLPPNAELSPQAQVAVQAYGEHTRVARDAAQQSARRAASPAPARQGTIELLRDLEIRPRFLESLEAAEQSVLIVSPWMTEQVVDEDFLRLLERLAKRDVVVLLGWGIARERQAEERSPPPFLLEYLHEIKTPAGIPAVAVWWLGNQHSKDVLIDRRIHMSGSHNWLSYRGDWRPRGESTYYVSVPEPVARASRHIQGLFCGAADHAWAEAIQATLPSESVLKRCCVTWVMAREIEHALRKILSLSIKRPAFAPLCLELARAICLLCVRLPTAELLDMEVLAHLIRAAPDLVKRTEHAGYDAQKIDEFGMALKDLLKRFKGEHRSQVSSLLEKQRVLSQRLGLMHSKEDPEGTAERLRGTRRKKGKGQSS